MNTKPAPEANPWILAAPDQNEITPLPALPPQHLPAIPAGISAPAASQLLPTRHRHHPARVWWVGAHGGAGESTFAALHAHDAPADHAWPITAAAEPPTVVVIARTHHDGLIAAQRAARHWASGALPSVNLLGVVLAADAPGRLPKPLRTLAAIVSGGYPRAWEIPWVPSWRFGATVPTDRMPSPLLTLQRDLHELTKT